MKTHFFKAGATIILCTVFSGALTAQKSTYFNYNRDSVNTAMEQITESTASPEPFFITARDSSNTKPLGIPFSLTIGFLSGCIVTTGGCLIGFLISDIEAAKIGLIIGSVLGSVLPPVVVYSNTKSPKDAGFTVLGGVAGLVPPIVVFAATAEAVRDITDTVNDLSDLWNELFNPETNQSCTGFFPVASAGRLVSRMID